MSAKKGIYQRFLSFDLQASKSKVAFADPISVGVAELWVNLVQGPREELALSLVFEQFKDALKDCILEPTKTMNGNPWSPCKMGTFRARVGRDTWKIAVGVKYTHTYTG